MNFNYSTYAIEDLTKLSKKCALQGYEKSADALLTICDELKNAIKFIMPDGGRLFEGNGPIFTRKDADLLRLPFPSIVLEYFISDDNFHTGAPVESGKRIALCVDHPTGILVFSIYFFDKRAMWWMCPACAFVPKQQSTDPDDLEHIDVDGCKRSDLEWIMVPLLEELCAKYRKAVGKEKQRKDFALDLMDELNAMLSFLIAKSCSNVYIKNNGPQNKINKKRIKNGKLPFYSYKTLEIKVPLIVKHSDSVDCEKNKRNSPRIHLRQGHRRRLGNGKTIWVNHCMVGSKKRGFVHKDYLYSINKKVADEITEIKKGKVKHGKTFLDGAPGPFGHGPINPPA